MDEATTGTCRHCKRPILFIRIIREDWDWVDDRWGSICPFSKSLEHYPVNPVEGIDY